VRLAFLRSVGFGPSSALQGLQAGEFGHMSKAAKNRSPVKTERTVLLDYALGFLLAGHLYALGVILPFTLPPGTWRVRIRMSAYDP
jgi:hypothetical protein